MLTHSISCEECNLIMCEECDRSQHLKLHTHSRWLQSATAGRRGLDAEQISFEGVVMRVRLDATNYSSLAASLTATRSCSACDDGALVLGMPSAQDMFVWTEKGGFTWSKPYICCDSQTCLEYSAGVATASDVEHFLGFKSLAPIAANVVLASGPSV
ncbi:hypothetical protein T492DRAFT_908698 [Pavlovales sp. CCMP2436]|nr:hypothetical protein T492DRAFT_908698 [Pavlovales sp. CCMP2436]